MPRAKRVHGYFSMPVLGGDRLVGPVDPGRVGRTLVGKHVSLDTSSAAVHVAAALCEAASWVGADDIVIEKVTPPGRTAEMRALAAAAVRG